MLYAIGDNVRIFRSEEEGIDDYGEMNYESGCEYIPEERNDM